MTLYGHSFRSLYVYVKNDCEVPFLKLELVQLATNIDDCQVNNTYIKLLQMDQFIHFSHTCVLMDFKRSFIL